MQFATFPTLSIRPFAIMQSRNHAIRQGSPLRALTICRERCPFRNFPSNNLEVSEILPIFATRKCNFKIFIDYEQHYNNKGRDRDVPAG